MQNSNIYNNNNNSLYGGNPLPPTSGEAGPAGPAGPAGEAGKDGADGKDGEPGKVDIDAIVVEVTKRLKPITVNFQDGAGNPTGVQTVPLGGVLNIPAVKLWWKDLSGNILKQAVPLGDPLKAANIEINKKPK
jgi:hypothetical protein